MGQNDQPADSNIAEIAAAGEIILESFEYYRDVDETGSTWIRYISIVQLRSYTRYVPQIIANIENAKRPGFRPDRFKMENYPRIMLLFKEMMKYQLLYENYYQYRHQAFMEVRRSYE
jgi:hypothetical protein